MSPPAEATARSAARLSDTTLPTHDGSRCESHSRPPPGSDDRLLLLASRRSTSHSSGGGQVVVRVLLEERHETDAGLVVVEHEVAFDRVADAARREDAVAHREQRDVDRRGVRLVVRVHDVADDRRLALGVAQLVAARVRHDAGPVVAERRVDDQQVAARVRARVAEAVVLARARRRSRRRTGSTGRCSTPASGLPLV